MITLIVFILIALIFGFGIVSYRKVVHPKWKVPTEPFPVNWRTILVQEVVFYNALEPDEKTRFEYKVQEFLLNCRITGIKTEVSLTDKLLVASSAVIPIFGFDSWKYSNIHEVLLYPDMFDENYQFEGETDRRILGMVGNQSMEGIMILSKQALNLAFKNDSDKHNTAIHEFVHLIDKSDGEVDGLPKVLMDRKYAMPWIALMNKEIEKIYEGKSDINPYGATNRAEFLSVTSEYFFEQPRLLEEKNPELYALLEKIFTSIGANVVSFPYGPMPTQPLGWFKNPIESADALKNLKYRTVGLSADLNGVMGAAVTIMGGGDIVPAMDRGLLDAAEFNNPSSDKVLGFPDVSKVYMLQSYHQSAECFEIIFNRTKYNALPQELRSKLRVTQQCRAEDLVARLVADTDSGEALPGPNRLSM